MPWRTKPGGRSNRTSALPVPVAAADGLVDDHHAEGQVVEHRLQEGGGAPHLLLGRRCAPSCRCRWRRSRRWAAAGRGFPAPCRRAGSARRHAEASCRPARPAPGPAPPGRPARIGHAWALNNATLERWGGLSGSNSSSGKLSNSLIFGIPGDKARSLSISVTPLGRLSMMVWNTRSSSPSFNAIRSPLRCVHASPDLASDGCLSEGIRPRRFAP